MILFFFLLINNQQTKHENEAKSCEQEEKVSEIIGHFVTVKKMSKNDQIKVLLSNITPN